MALIRQMVKKNYRSNDIAASAADLAVIVSLMEGEISTFDLKSQGGTDVLTPSVLRGMKFGVSRKADNLSCTVGIKHVKPTKHSTDVFTHLALFDANYESALTATKITQIYQGAKA